MSKSNAKPKATQVRTERPPSDDSAARRQRIAEAAYYEAERRGFAPGGEEADWLKAEQEVDGEGREH